MFRPQEAMSKIILLMLILFSNCLFAQQVAKRDSSLNPPGNASSDSLMNLLRMNSMMLNEVNIKGIKNYKADSLNRRREYASIFAYKGPSVMDAFIKKSSEISKDYTAFQNSTSSIASINVLQVLGMLTKNKSSASKLKKALLKEEKSRFLDERFSKEKIIAVTSLQGDSLDNFIDKYRPSAARATEMNEYEMLIYIKTSFAEFRKAQRKE